MNLASLFCGVGALFLLGSIWGAYMSPWGTIE